MKENMIKRSFKLYFQHLFKIIVVGLLWLLTSLPLFTIGPATLAYAYYIYQIVDREDSRLRFYWEGLHRYFWAGMKLQFAIGLPLVILIGDFLFFIPMEHFAAKLFALVALYVALGWIHFNQFSFVSIAALNKKVVWSVLKINWYLALKHPWPCLLFFPFTLICLIFLPAVAVFVVFFFPVHTLMAHHFIDRFLRQE